MTFPLNFAADIDSRDAIILEAGFSAGMIAIVRIDAQTNVLSCFAVTEHVNVAHTTCAAILHEIGERVRKHKVARDKLAVVFPNGEVIFENEIARANADYFRYCAMQDSE